MLSQVEKLSVHLSEIDNCIVRSPVRRSCSKNLYKAFTTIWLKGKTILTSASTNYPQCWSWNLNSSYLETCMFRTLLYVRNLRFWCKHRIKVSFLKCHILLILTTATEKFSIDSYSKLIKTSNISWHWYKSAEQVRFQRSDRQRILSRFILTSFNNEAKPQVFTLLHVSSTFEVCRLWPSLEI